ncbi:Autoinducer 2 import system permease protein lsrD [Leclercia adecarboxylata]|uniref:Autoinducer 2 import system permease protein LsrD n=1 Tax=Leclercia adecarboxylata TaxID=83655 RepID=A0A4U9IPM3_9ENTR|nr:Autoinducer 2 import system permease protein lsrD [Leclercia adecarboxylata]
MKLNWEWALLLLLVLEILLFGTLNPRMLDINMLLFSTSDFICIGIVALPLTLVIISGGIDISLGSTIGLCAIALGVMMQSGVPMAAAIPLTLLLGLLCGLFNAALIHYTGISPLVITLGTLYLYGGGALLLSGMAGATGYEGIGGFPESFTAFANLTLLGLPIPLVLFAVITFFFWLIVHRGRFGRHLFLIGQNPRAARYAALSVNGMPYALYGLVGVASAIAALVMVSYFGSARSDLGRDLLMPRAYRRGARRGEYLWRFRFGCGYGTGGVAGGVLTAGVTDGRHSQPGVERAVRGAAGCGGHGAFAEFAP